MPLCLLQCWGIDLIHLDIKTTFCFSMFYCISLLCFDSLHMIFALRFLLGCLSGKVHHVHYQLVFFAQRSFKSLPREWAHPTKEKPCKLNDADHIWLYLMTRYFTVPVCHLWKPFQPSCQASVPSYAACSKSGGRYLFTHTSTGEALRVMVHGCMKSIAYVTPPLQLATKDGVAQKLCRSKTEMNRSV